jgi:GT2 family glycosyltransferase
VAIRLNDPEPSRAATKRQPTDEVAAVVVTHMRPRLAGDLVRSLIEVEGLPADRVIVVVNGKGGLDDPDLEASVVMLRLASNDGPAAGFRAGIEEAFRDPSTRWAYLCEDDVGLLPLPAPRLTDLLERIEALDRPSPPVGAVVAYGRDLSHRSGNAVNIVPGPGSPQDFKPVDVSAWGATLLSREVAEAGVLPDPTWFFGLEDFDYFCRLREAGFSVLVDGVAARSVEKHQTSKGREELHLGIRPVDSAESWRAYYQARNFFVFARRHGKASWLVSHLAFSARRLQLSRTRAERVAIIRGIADGMRLKLGRHPGYQRVVGEHPNGEDSGPEETGTTQPD